MPKKKNPLDLEFIKNYGYFLKYFLFENKIYTKLLTANPNRKIIILFGMIFINWFRITTIFHGSCWTEPNREK